MSQEHKDHRDREPLVRPSDRREGQWTKLHLLEMDERFRTAVRRELVEPAAQAGKPADGVVQFPGAPRRNNGHHPDDQRA